jgi:hypothetical protein
VKPHPDDGFMRGIIIALGPCLLIWAGIFWLIFSGWSA